MIPWLWILPIGTMSLHLAFNYLSPPSYPFPGITGPLIDLLKHEQTHSVITVKMVTEINWLFAFLTAKEDSTVSTLIDEGLIEV